MNSDLPKEAADEMQKIIENFEKTVKEMHEDFFSKALKEMIKNNSPK